MIEPKKIVEVLRAKIDLLDKLDGQQLGGFAVIFPPQGSQIEAILLGSDTDDVSFYKHIVDKWAKTLEQSGYGGTINKIR